MYGGIAAIWGFGAWIVAKRKEPSVLGWRAEAIFLAVLCAQWLFCAIYVPQFNAEEIRLLGKLIGALLFVIPMMLYIGIHVLLRLRNLFRASDADDDTTDT